MTAVCPACRRPVAMAHPRCVYCGALLPAEALEQIAAARTATVTDAPPEGRPARAVILVRLAGTAPDRLSRALRLSAYDADLKIRRGGVHLHRALPAVEAEREATELTARGLDVLVVPEEEVRAAPVVVEGGGPEGGLLRLGTAGGEERLAREDLLVIVKGPIAREYQAPTTDVRRLPTATLSTGARVHLHLRRGPGPVEIDPAEFAFGPDADVLGSERTIASWIATLFSGLPLDEGFRWLTPALAPAAPAGRAEAPALLARPARAARLVLDNVAQFRYYSGLCAAAERRRRG